MEQLTSFISSRGIMKSCTSHQRDPMSSRPDIDQDLLRHHRHGETIYVCTDGLHNFAENFLPRLDKSFVLVSGDSDKEVSDSLIDDLAISRILASGALRAWYAQNLSARHAKLFQLPIGLDYHTMRAHPGHWGLSALSPVAQEHALISALSTSPEFDRRYLAAYCNWHFAMQRGDRQRCYGAIDKSVCYFEPNPIPRNSSWMRQSECMFVISPEGGGLDCHRTWEAILLGCIPVLKRNALSPLFDQLPALIVDDWADVNRDLLLDHVKRVGDREFDFSCLFKDYWVRRMNTGEVPATLPPMNMAAFRRFLTLRTG
jgi:hypothetical protein